MGWLEQCLDEALAVRSWGEEIVRDGTKRISRSQTIKGLVRPQEVFTLLEVPKGQMVEFFTLAMAAGGYILGEQYWRQGHPFRRPCQGTREEEDSNQEGTHENRGERMWSRNIQEIKLTEHHGDWLEYEGEQVIEDNSQVPQWGSGSTEMGHTGEKTVKCNGRFCDSTDTSLKLGRNGI